MEILIKFAIKGAEGSFWLDRERAEKQMQPKPDPAAKPLQWNQWGSDIIILILIIYVDVRLGMSL